MAPADIKELLRGKETTILNALGIRWAGQNREHIKCPFPSHDDKHPSWRWDDQKGKFFCTCSNGSIIDAVIAMRGGDFAEASAWCREIIGVPAQKRSDNPFHHSKHGTPSRTWSYRNADGAVVGIAARYDTPKGKQVIPWIPDGKGGWLAKAMPVPRPLYNLPDLLSARQKPVLVTEGEKAADAAAKLFPDHTVTTSAGGCKAWKQTDWSPLNGRRIVIWPDNDDEGRLYARNVAGELGEAVAIVEIPKDWPLKWDLADPAPAGVSLEAMIAAARPYDKNPAAMPKASDVTDDFERDDQGRLLKNEGNVLRALKWAPIVVRYDCFADRYEIAGLDGYGPVLDDHGIDELYLQIQREHGLKPTKQDFDRIILASARRSRFHPVKDYLERLQWDGNDRIDEWLSTYAGAQNDPYTCAVGRIFLIAAVRRIYEPGIKFDEMMIWEGPQGTFKSTGVATLCPNADWLSESLSLSVDEKAIIEQTTGKWIIEIGELSGYRKREIEHIKEFLSRRVDSARPAYGRMRIDRPRQFVFIGTTNETNYLMDDTGDRRFWPVRIDKVDIASLARDRDQLWAEATYFAKRGESIYLPHALQPAAKAEQDKRAQEDEWQEIVEDWLIKALRNRDLLSPDGCRTTIATVAKEALNVEAAKLEPIVQKRLMRCLKRAGWRKAERSDGRNFWRPGESAVQ